MAIDNFFIFGLIFIFIYLLLMYLRKKNSETAKKETLDYNEIENIYFNKIKEGNAAYKLLNIYTPLDLMMIKSFFISENIPYYVEFEHLMKVQPYIHCQNYNNVNIYILEEDYNDAIIVIDEYIKSKKLNEYKAGFVFRSIFEYLCTSWVIPSPHYFLGFEINYKV